MRNSLFTRKSTAIYFVCLLLLIALGWWIITFLKVPASLIYKNVESISTCNMKNPKDIQQKILLRTDIQLLEKYLMDDKMLPTDSPEISKEEREKRTENYFYNKISFLWNISRLKNPAFDRVLSLYYYGEYPLKDSVNYKNICGKALSVLLKDYNRITGKQITTRLEDSDFEVLLDMESNNKILVLENYKQAKEIPRILEGYIIFQKTDNQACILPCESQHSTKIMNEFF